MAIQPAYSQAILDGRKLVEFRKRPLAADVRTVLIYESAPTRRVVGFFTIGQTVRSSPSALWAQFGTVGCISRSRFRTYYAGTTEAFGIVVEEATRLPEPIALADLSIQPTVPQSFAYLPASVLAELGSQTRPARLPDWAMQEARRIPQRLLTGLARPSLRCRTRSLAHEE